MEALASSSPTPAPVPQPRGRPRTATAGTESVMGTGAMTAKGAGGGGGAWHRTTTPDGFRVATNAHGRRSAKMRRDPRRGKSTSSSRQRRRRRWPSPRRAAAPEPACPGRSHHRPRRPGRCPRRPPKPVPARAAAARARARRLRAPRPAEGGAAAPGTMAGGEFDEAARPFKATRLAAGATSGLGLATPKRRWPSRAPWAGGVATALAAVAAAHDDRGRGARDGGGGG